MANGDDGTENGEVTAAALPAEFGQLLRTLRLREGFSQQKLAMAVFDSTRKSSIGELENDPQRVPHPHTIKKLTDALNLSDPERLLLAAAAERRRRPTGRAGLAVAQSVVDSAGGVPEPDQVQVNQGDPTQAGHEASPAPTIPPTDPESVAAPHRKWAIWVAATAVLAILGVAALIRTTEYQSRDSSASTSAAQNSTEETIPQRTTGATVTSGPLTGPTSNLRASGSGELTMNIESPLDGQIIDSPLTVRGTAQLPQSHKLWLIVHPVTDTTYYTTTEAPITVDETGAWATRPRIGRGPQDEGYKFDLFAVVAPTGGTIDQEIAKRPPQQYSARLSQIPADATVTARLRLTLGRYTG